MILVHLIFLHFAISIFVPDPNRPAGSASVTRHSFLSACTLPASTQLYLKPPKKTSQSFLGPRTCQLALGSSLDESSPISRERRHLVIFHLDELAGLHQSTRSYSSITLGRSGGLEDAEETLKHSCLQKHHSWRNRRSAKSAKFYCVAMTACPEHCNYSDVDTLQHRGQNLSTWNKQMQQMPCSSYPRSISHRNATAVQVSDSEAAINIKQQRISDVPGKTWRVIKHFRRTANDSLSRSARRAPCGGFGSAAWFCTMTLQRGLGRPAMHSKLAHICANRINIINTVACLLDDALVPSQRFTLQDAPWVLAYRVGGF
ncbi:unnamed protein product [Diplocarpon coronariae]|nr:hypothetical protein JHW43_002670 [Diplocarpon mali]